ncbi:MAG: phosphatase PAP2 family protein [Lachnospiraceae bacterium]|nr:phosphatase PAP2 family protein [Lachnospiraceae bacterium]
MNASWYGKVRKWFLEAPWRMALLTAAYRGLPLFVAAGYPICLVFCLLYRRELLARAILVPAAMFLAVSVFRHFVNFARPYEKEGIVPLIQKEKQGHSFPSRHAASAGMVAAVWMAYSRPAGILFLAVGILIAVSRVLAGVHYVKDVLAGGVSGYFAVWIFFM